MTDVPPHTRWPILYRTVPFRPLITREGEHHPHLRRMGRDGGYLMICSQVDAVFTADTPEEAIAKWDQFVASKAFI